MPIRSRLFACALLALVFIIAGTSNAVGSDKIEQAGNVLTIALATTAVGVTATEQDGEGLVQFGKSLALSLGVTAALKYSINEERPNGKDHSFPSGHTSFSFTSAEFMRKRYGWEFGLPAYAAASFVGYSRVEADKHYWHDVMTGAAIGIASSYLFTKPYHGINVTMVGGEKFVGMCLSRNW